MVEFMPQTLTAQLNGAHLQRLEDRRLPDLHKVEMQYRAAVGRALERAHQKRGWTQKELAAAIDRDQSQVAKWIKGIERVQLDALLAEATFWPLFVVALAEIPGSGIVITTQLTVSRAA